MNIEKIERIQELQRFQQGRGFNTIRQEMIQELLLELQKEITDALIHNASQPNT